MSFCLASWWNLPGDLFLQSWVATCGVLRMWWEHFVSQSRSHCHLKYTFSAFPLLPFNLYFFFFLTVIVMNRTKMQTHTQYGNESYQTSIFMTLQKQRRGLIHIPVVSIYNTIAQILVVCWGWFLIVRLEWQVSLHTWASKASTLTQWHQKSQQNNSRRQIILF